MRGEIGDGGDVESDLAVAMETQSENIVEGNLAVASLCSFLLFFFFLIPLALRRITNSEFKLRGGAVSMYYGYCVRSGVIDHRCPRLRVLYSQNK